ncbi:MAG: SirB2 family protein [Sideroxydans sp.]|nr:SirB2 family protein [Sideroxydans sp.]
MLASKIIHVGSVAASYSLFFMRGIWLLRGSPVMLRRWVKIAPQIVDSVLLASAISLAWQLDYSPLNAPWLAAKLIALLLYIGLGMLAFRFSKTRKMRFVAWLGAQAVFFYIVAVAITHDPLLSN